MIRHGFGRKYVEDVRDRRFLMADRMALTARPKKRHHALWWKGDQGTTPHCVGFMGHALLRAYPVLQREPEAHALYFECLKVDEWPGEADEGTSVRACMKVLKAQGKILSYGWAHEVNTVLQWLGLYGPVGLGTSWKEGMAETDRKGFVRVTGETLGGHAYTALGYDDTKVNAAGQKGGVLCQNSWGKNWGENGRFWISYDDLRILLREEGSEACTPLEVAA